MKKRRKASRRSTRNSLPISQSKMAFFLAALHACFYVGATSAIDTAFNPIASEIKQHCLLPTIDFIDVDEKGRLGVYSNTTQTFLLVRPPKEIISGSYLPVARDACGLEYLGNGRWGILVPDGYNKQLLILRSGETEIHDKVTLSSDDVVDIRSPTDDSIFVLSKYRLVPYKRTNRGYRQTKSIDIRAEIGALTQQADVVQMGTRGYSGLFKSYFGQLVYYESRGIDHGYSQLSPNLKASYDFEFRDEVMGNALFWAIYSRPPRDLCRLAVSATGEIFLAVQDTALLANRIRVQRFSPTAQMLDSFTLTIFTGDPAPLTSFLVGEDGMLVFKKTMDPRAIRTTKAGRPVDIIRGDGLTHRYRIVRNIDWLDATTASGWIGRAKVVFLDVSDLSDYNLEHANGARSFSLSRMNELERLFPDRDAIYFLIGSGTTLESGYHDFKTRRHASFMIRGGTSRWIKAGLPHHSGRRLALATDTLLISDYDLWQIRNGKKTHVAGFALPTATLLAEYRPSIVTEAPLETLALRLSAESAEEAGMTDMEYSLENIESKITAWHAHADKLWVGFGFFDKGEGVVGYGGIGVVDWSNGEAGVLRHPFLVGCSATQIMISDNRLYVALQDHDGKFGDRGLALWELDLTSLDAKGYAPGSKDDLRYDQMPLTDLLAYRPRMKPVKSANWTADVRQGILRMGLERYMKIQAIRERQVRIDSLERAAFLLDTIVWMDGDRRQTRLAVDRIHMRLNVWPEDSFPSRCSRNGFYGLGIYRGDQSFWSLCPPGQRGFAQATCDTADPKTVRIIENGRYLISMEVADYTSDHMTCTGDYASSSGNVFTSLRLRIAVKRLWDKFRNLKIARIKSGGC